jgi:hypothetical protein
MWVVKAGPGDFDKESETEPKELSLDLRVFNGWQSKIL